MSRHMRTTVRINDDLLRNAKNRAASEGRTLTSLIEEGLLIVLSSPRRNSTKRIELPVSNATGGVMPGVDLNCAAELEDLMNTP